MMLIEVVSLIVLGSVGILFSVALVYHLLVGCWRESWCVKRDKELVALHSWNERRNS